MQVSRRQFFKICAGGMAGTTAATLGNGYTSPGAPFRSGTAQKKQSPARDS